MHILRTISALCLLTAYLLGFGVQTVHALLAHQDEHPVCTAEGEKHLHGEDYHFDACNLCNFTLGQDNTPETSHISSSKQIPFFKKNAPQHEAFFIVKNKTTFQKRGPPNRLIFS